MSKDQSQQVSPQNSNRTEGRDRSSLVPIIVALIGAIVTLITAFIAPMVNDQRHVSMTQTADALHVSYTMTAQALLFMSTSTPSITLPSTNTETSIPSSTPTVTPSFTPRPTQTKILPPTRTPTITPLPPANYGGLRYGCIDTTYWYLDGGPKPRPGECWNLSQWGLNADTQAFRIDIDNANTLEKAVSMNISQSKNLDISFRLVITGMSGVSETVAPRLAIGICEPDKLRYEHAFVYYDLFESKLASAITINGFDNKKEYYFYDSTQRTYRLELRSYDLTIFSGTSKIGNPITIKRTENTSFCLNYRLPEGGSLHSVIDQIDIEKK